MLKWKTSIQVQRRVHVQQERRLRGDAQDPQELPVLPLPPLRGVGHEAELGPGRRRAQGRRGRRGVGGEFGGKKVTLRRWRRQLLHFLALLLLLFWGRGVFPDVVFHVVAASAAADGAACAPLAGGLVRRRRVLAGGGDGGGQRNSGSRPKSKMKIEV